MLDNNSRFQGSRFRGKPPVIGTDTNNNRQVRLLLT